MLFHGVLLACRCRWGGRARLPLPHGPRVRARAHSVQLGRGTRAFLIRRTKIFLRRPIAGAGSGPGMRRGWRAQWFARGIDPACVCPGANRRCFARQGGRPCARGVPRRA
ncbi:type III secretion system protein (plasmid) [Ralstonia solanacearum]|nr:type III secretion system protein [Ralstonia solanacearum]